MKFSAHLSMLFRELPYLERPAAAAEAGFTVVETWWPGQEAVDAWAVEALRHSLDVRLINCDGGDLAAGERGFLNVPERRDDTLAAVSAAAETAARCGAPYVNLLVGRDTRRLARREQLRLAAAVVSDCAAIAREAGVQIVIEPINDLDVPGYLVPSPDEAVRLLEAAACDGVLLLYDAYHSARMGFDPCVDVTRWLPLVAHVHYADCPGRGAPGTGTTDLMRFVEVLEGGGYTGAIGLEFDPGPSTLEALEGIVHGRG